MYAAIADRVVETAREHGEIVYAVPGSPTIAERSVELLRGAGIDVELDPGHLVRRPRVVAARHRPDARRARRRRRARSRSTPPVRAGRCCIAQCDSQLVCSDVKLALLESLPPDHEVTVLQRLGLPDERVFTVALEDLDRDGRARPPHVGVRRHRRRPVSGPSSRACSRSPSGCAVRADARGTRRRPTTRCAATCSKRRTKWSEAIEQLPADAPGGDIPIGAYDALEDELGDLLFQVMIQSVLASEAGAFTVADVARGGAHQARAPPPARVRRRRR